MQSEKLQYIQNTATNLQGIWISAVQDPARSKWPAFSSSYEGGTEEPRNSETVSPY